MAEKDLKISASNDLDISVMGADFVIVSTPTNYDEKTNFLDTSSVEAVIAPIVVGNPKVCIVVKSTISAGFIETIKERLWIPTQ